ncbi:hypothetical protein C7474_0060 [Microbacterium telephonicum]|uniref:Uncharacterized protein n=1 Tax=Microbacterium telephonicum TaxID=1714841 RepID=A0A498C9D4_9MICO|nr:hypothetical protein C7474_0060 [Microbacterium telephonicum]
MTPDSGIRAHGAPIGTRIDMPVVVPDEPDNPAERITES